MNEYTRRVSQRESVSREGVEVVEVVGQRANDVGRTATPHNCSTAASLSQKQPRNLPPESPGESPPDPRLCGIGGFINIECMNSQYGESNGG